MPSDDPLESATKGATSAVLNWSKDQIAQLIKKFKQRELLFIEDQETIDSVFTQRGKPEFKLCNQYLTDRDLRLQIQMGFTLRYFEKVSDSKKLQSLRSKILAKYGRKGLQVAELVQCGLFTRYVGLLLTGIENERELQQGIETILNEIDKYTLFVQADVDISKTALVLSQRLNVNLPPALIIFSRGKIAMERADKIVKLVEKKVSDYNVEVQFDTDSLQKFHFFLKVPRTTN